MRVVLDSNIFVSAFTLPGGSADHAVGAAIEGRYTVLISEPLLGEVLGVLGRRFVHDKEELARVALFLSDLAEIVTPRKRIKVLSDEPDNRVLECAVEGGARRIVTRDRELLRLARFEEVEIVSLRDLLDHLSSLD